MYLEDLLIYMLPKELAVDKASLVENKPRYADSHYYVISPEGKIESSVMMKTIIINNKKMTPDEVDEILRTNKTENQELNNTIHNLKEVSKIIRNNIFDEYNINTINNDITSSHKIITYTMMLENISIATYFNKNNYPLIYRVCEEIDTIKEIKNLIEEEQTLDEIIYEIDKNNKKVTYGTIGKHSELGLPCYCHSTSPIRRFADLWNRYLILTFKNKNITENQINYLRKKTENIVKKLNKVLDNHNYFSIEYSKKIKLLK